MEGRHHIQQMRHLHLEHPGCCANVRLLHNFQKLDRKFRPTFSALVDQSAKAKPHTSPRTAWWVFVISTFKLSKCFRNSNLAARRSDKEGKTRQDKTGSWRHATTFLDHYIHNCAIQLCHWTVSLNCAIELCHWNLPLNCVIGNVYRVASTTLA